MPSNQTHVNQAKAKKPVSAVAIIRRRKYPCEYSGWSVELDAPRWVKEKIDAATFPLERLVEELNKIAAREHDVWGVVYPQNGKK